MNCDKHKHVQRPVTKHDLIESKSWIHVHQLLLQFATQAMHAREAD